MNSITKRDGKIVPFDINKIAAAIEKAFIATAEESVITRRAISLEIAQYISNELDKSYSDPVYIEDVQDEVERTLMKYRYQTSAKAYILYRAERERQRDKNSRLMKTLDEIARSDAKDNDVKRENANIDGNTAMGTMLKFGSESAKAYYRTHMLPDKIREAHEEGDIHIHDLDFYNLTMTCCQIDLTRLFKDGFSTGHGFLREPQHIASYGALAAIALQANQNDMHGGQSIPNFERDMAPGVAKTFSKTFANRLVDVYADCGITDDSAADAVGVILANMQEKPMLVNSDGYDAVIAEKLSLDFRNIYCGDLTLDKDAALDVVARARVRAIRETDKATYKAMVALVHNLNTMHSRAGAQVPFSSLNYGTDTSPEGRMVIKNILRATIAGLGKGETPIFPIQVFRLKKGVNMEPGDPNYDMFRLALQCSAKRMFPNFAFQDAPFNLQYYKPGVPQTEIAYMGCRTRVIGNVFDPEQEISYSRGNLSFTTINLPRLAIMSRNLPELYKLLDEKLELVAAQLLERFSVQASKKVYNFPFLMGQGVWLDSDKLEDTESIAEVIKHGTLSIGFIGLAEMLMSLCGGNHHGKSTVAQQIGLEVVSHMRAFCDRKSAETGLNFTLLATPAEGLSGRFVRLDRERFGIIRDVTDKDYYTNSFHIPVGYEITACEKIRIEAPYHELTNAGHISYIELDGNLANNLDAFEQVVKHMGKCGIGYGAVNHPLDRDPVCGYTGVIHDECPKCGRKEADGVPFERIRRITGYLVGTIERFNNAKRAEERDRVKHR